MGDVVVDFLCFSGADGLGEVVVDGKKERI